MLPMTLNQITAVARTDLCKSHFKMPSDFDTEYLNKIVVTQNLLKAAF